MTAASEKSMANNMSGKEPVNKDRRNWIVATAAVGGVGVASVAVPFVSTFQPTERAKAAGAAVEVDISAVKPGEKNHG